MQFTMLLLCIRVRDPNLFSLPAIPYTVKVTTGPEKSMGTDSNAYIKIIGSTKRRHTGRQFLELIQKKSFLPGSIETFSLDAADVGEVKQIEASRVLHIIYIY